MFGLLWLGKDLPQNDSKVSPSGVLCLKDEDAVKKE